MDEFNKDLFSIEGTKLIKYKNPDGITEVTIPDGVTSIGNGAFFLCYELKKVVIPKRFRENIESIFEGEIVDSSGKCEFIYT